MAGDKIRRDYRRLVGPPPARVLNKSVPGNVCPKGKLAYRSKAAAKLALRMVKGVRRAQRRAGVECGHERSEYRCPLCGFWHLTSWEKR